jgi:hypothetical protein
MKRRRVRRIRVGAVRPKAADAKSFRAPARIAQQAKQPADVEQARGNRSSDSQQERDRLALRITAFMRVHCFYLTVINKALYGQNHCLLPIENSHNQPQQAKARTAQKSSNLTEKVRHLQDIFR